MSCISSIQIKEVYLLYCSESALPNSPVKLVSAVLGKGRRLICLMQH